VKFLTLVQTGLLTSAHINRTIADFNFDFIFVLAGSNCREMEKRTHVNQNTITLIMSKISKDLYYTDREEKSNAQKDAGTS